MPDLPSGTVTFLFTDIEGSTRLWEGHAQAMRPALARHDALLRQAIEDNKGVVFKTVGDAFCAAFATAPDALQAALSAHLLLREETWEGTGPLRVRMGLHTGTAEERDGDYFGQTLNRVARLQAVGHGQQTLLSQTTYALVCDRLPAQVTLADMGPHRLKDLLAPEHVWQLLHPALPAEFPPLKSLDYLPTNLPRQMTSFIGRKQEMEQVKRLLPSTPLLTLLGSGGAGKTRLAVQVGAEVLDDYKDGVWLAELAALGDPALISQAVAGVLGLREEPGRPLLNTLQDYLRDRQLLLILDNCEHLLNACAHLATSLLTSCPHLSILATSREPLGIAGEHPWRVPSLLTPGPDDLPMEEKDIAAVLMEYDACRLFVERAVMQRQDFVLTRSNVPVVAHLCQHLDGIPLAIELAAARVRSLSVEEINRRLDNRFRLLTGGSRTALPRQQTLRALIDWSYDLLTDQEKVLLARLSVFAGGWNLAAAERVCGLDPIEDWAVLDLLTSLVDKSLVLPEQHGEAMRYRLLETVRQYGQERLAGSGESQRVRVRHRDFYLEWAEAAEPNLAGPDQASWLSRLEVEHDNLRLALALCREESEGGGAEAGLRLGAALGLFWRVRGYWGEGRSHLAAALARAVGSESPQVRKARARVLVNAGELAWPQCDYMASRTLAEEGLTLCRELRDKWGMAYALTILGATARWQGNYGEARSFFEECLAIYWELGDKGGIASTLSELGWLAQEQGKFDDTRSFFEESLIIRREVGDKRLTAHALHNLGWLAQVQGDDGEARPLFEESLAIFRELGDRHSISHALHNLGIVASYQGNYGEARSLFEESLTIRRELGAKHNIAQTLIFMGLNVLDQGNNSEACSLFEESLTLFREIGDKRSVADCLDALAALACHQGRAVRAPRLWGAATAVHEAITAARYPQQQERYERETAQVRATLGDAAFNAAFAEGRAMTLEQAIEYALGSEGEM